MLCTLVLNGVVSALRALPFDIGKEFRVVTVSFNPHETSELAAAKKATYLERVPPARAPTRAGTSSSATRRRSGPLMQAIGFRYAWDAAAKQYAHASGLVVLTPGGRVSHYFYGVEFAPRDLRLALVEASGERIGSVVDQLLLFCFHYDPATGRYSRVALNAVRAGGVLTLAALGLFIWRLAASRPSRWRGGQPPKADRMIEGFRLFPEQASTLAPQTDALLFFLLAITTFFVVLIAGLILVFMIRYRRHAPDDGSRRACTARSRSRSPGRSRRS